MLNFALEMKDVNYVNYLCFCLEHELVPCRAESLEEFKNGAYE